MSSHIPNDQKVYDYLDVPPKRWHQLGANGAFVVRDDGEWVKFTDMDLYMFEGGQLMQQMVAENARLRAALQSIAKDEGQAREAVAKGFHNTTFAIDLAGRARAALDVGPLTALDVPK